MDIKILKESLKKEINKIEDEDLLKSILVYFDERDKGNLNFDLFEYYEKLKQTKNK